MVNVLLQFILKDFFIKKVKGEAAHENLFSPTRARR